MKPLSMATRPDAFRRASLASGHTLVRALVGRTVLGCLELRYALMRLDLDLVRYDIVLVLLM